MTTYKFSLIITDKNDNAVGEQHAWGLSGRTNANALRNVRRTINRYLNEAIKREEGVFDD